MAIEIVDFPIENGGSFHSYVNLPEGKLEQALPIFQSKKSPSWLTIVSTNIPSNMS